MTLYYFYGSIFIMSRGVVIGLASLPGAGKGELAVQLELLGAEHFHVGNVVRATAQANDFKPEGNAREAYLPFWRVYSAEHGENWLARLAMAHATEKQCPVVVDGVRIAADAETIASTGTMYWLHGDLPTLAERVIKRSRVEDGNTLSVDDYVEVMERDLANMGNFSMGAVRELCTIHLLPVPEIQGEIERAENYHRLAVHVLETSGLRQ